MEIHVTALLELLGIPFTGSGAHALAISYDKDMVLQLVKSIGKYSLKSHLLTFCIVMRIRGVVHADVPSPRSCMLAEGHELEHNLPYPVFVKPNNTDGSFGITEKSICHNVEELSAAVAMIRETFRVHGPVLVQEYLPGKDVTVSLIGNPPAEQPIALPIIEEDYSVRDIHSDVF
jgi:D-alanine-D-alanine ligase